MKSIIIALCLWSVSALAAEDVNQAIQFPVEKYTLPNGLTVLLHEDHTIPAISLQTWFRVGSKDEKPGRTGLAHFFEHMMFKGTPKYPKDTFGRFFNSKGAETNAFTSNDMTGYYIDLPSEHTELALQVESDRMRNLTLDPKDVTSEREVVKEERRMRYDDSIEGGIREKMSELLYKSLPYRWLPIGSMTDLNAASMDDLRAFYKTYYSPGNATLVLAGDFQPGQAKALIEKYYGGLPREVIPAVTVVPEKPQTVMRRATITREAQSGTVAVAYPLPDVKNPDYYALDILSAVLGDGQSSRLYKRMVYHDQIATGVNSYAAGQMLAGAFYFNLALKPTTNAEKAIKLLEEEVTKVRDLAVSKQELEKARNSFFRSRVDNLKRVHGRSGLLAEYETVYGDYTRVFSEMANYQKVTVEDIQRVAQKYLLPNRRNVVVVTPKKAGT